MADEQLNAQHPPETSPDATDGLPVQTPEKRGVSPAILLFLMTGVLGLIAAGVMLATEPDNNAVQEAYNDLTSGRAIRDWEAPGFPATTLDGDAIQLTDYRGQVVFLNFWWTGCPPCVRELPALQTFSEEQAALGDEGAVVLAVNQGEDAEQIREFLAELNVDNITVLLDRPRDWGNEYGVTGFPTTYVIDAEGMVRWIKIGELEVEEMYAYLDSVTDDAETPDA